MHCDNTSIGVIEQAMCVFSISPSPSGSLLGCKVKIFKRKIVGGTKNLIILLNGFGNCCVNDKSNIRFVNSYNGGAYFISLSEKTKQKTLTM